MKIDINLAKQGSESAVPMILLHWIQNIFLLGIMATHIGMVI